MTRRRSLADVSGFKERARQDKAIKKRAKKDLRRAAKREVPQQSAQLPSWARPPSEES